MIYKYLNIDIKYMDTCMHVRVCVNIQVYKDCAWIFVEMKREIKKKKKKEQKRINQLVVTTRLVGN